MVKKGAPPAKAAQAAKQANSILEGCLADGGSEKECDRIAIATALKQIKGGDRMQDNPYRLRLSGLVQMAEEGQDVSHVQVATKGSWNHQVYGPFQVTDEDYASILTNAQAGRRGVKGPDGDWELLIDYDHASSGVGSPETGKAAGWLKVSSLAVEGGAMWADVRWTAAAADYIRKGEYRYFSPEIGYKYEDKSTGEDLGTVLIGGALTNRPFLEGPSAMAPVVLSESGGGPQAQVILGLAIKTVDGVAYPASAFAYAPDADKPSEWKLRLKSFTGGRLAYDMAIVSAAAAAFSPGGHRGQKVQLPAEAVAGAKANIRAAYKALGKKPDEMPSSIRGGEATMDESKLKELLGITGEEDQPSIEDAITALTEKAKTVINAEELAKENTALKEEIKKLKGEKVETEQQVEQLKETAKDGVTLAEVTKVRDENKQLSERVQALEKDRKDAECGEAIRQATEAGKLVPAMTDWARGLYMRDVESFNAYVEAAPVIVPMGERGTSGGAPEGDADARFEAKAREIAKEQKVSYTDALLLAEKDDPELAAEAHDMERARRPNQKTRP